MISRLQYPTPHPQIRRSQIIIEYKNFKYIKFLIKRLGSLTVIISLLWHSASGQRLTGPQQKPAFDVPTPNAASLGEYGQVPVNFYNGLPAISVPLHNFSYKDISIPISINYHAGGNRVESYPGWVGLGWTLEAGGAVTRIVNGFADEITTEDMNVQLGENPRATYPSGTDYGYFFYSKEYDRADWTDPNYLKMYLGGANGYQLSYNRDPFDGQPDEFMFNVGDLSGSFFMFRDSNNNLRVKVKSKSGEYLRIEPALTTNVDVKIFKELVTQSVAQTLVHMRRSFLSFVITRANGAKYTFGGNFDAIDLNTTATHNTNDHFVTLATTWYLTKIESPKGYAVTLEYKKQGDLIVKNCLTWTMISMPVSYNAGAESSRNNDIGLNIQHPSYLTKIAASDGSEVIFESHRSSQLGYDIMNPDNWADVLYQLAPLHDTAPNQPYNDYNYTLQLNAIRVKGVRSIVFTYSNTATQRLRLNKLAVTAATDASTFNYTFQYNNRLLPNYNTRQSDNWGYYNENAYGSSYKTSNPPDFDKLYDARMPALVLKYMQAEILESIVYPTKGISQFEYEPHDYSSIVLPSSFNLSSSSGYAGGLRIKKITSVTSSNDSNKQVWEYQYKKADNSSSGILSGKPTYSAQGQVHVKYEHELGCGFLCEVHASADYIQDYYLGKENPLFPLNNTSGNHVTYSRVVEKRTGQGYTVYNYTNHDTRDSNNKLLYNDQPALITLSNTAGSLLADPITSRELERGLLLSTEVYNESGMLVKKTENQYNDNPARYDDYVKSLDVRVIHTGNNQPYARVGAKKIYTFYPYLQKEIVTNYFSNSPATSITTNFSYNNYRLIASQSSVNSQGQLIQTTCRYPFDISYSNAQLPTESVASAVYAMTARNMLSYPIETVVSRSGKVIAATVQNYKWLGQANNSPILPYQRFELETSQQLPLPFSAVAYSNTSYLPMDIASQMRLKSTITQYDALGNPLNLLKDGGATISYLWGYNNTLPVAKVENAAPTEIIYSGFEEDKVTGTAGPDAANTWYSPGSYLRFEATPSDRPSTRSTAHTGRVGGAMYTGYQGEQAHAFSPTLTLPIRATSKRFVLSGWVYTNGPQASIWLFPNLPSARNSDGTVNYYDGLNNSSRPDLAPIPLSTNLTGQWVYLEREVDVPADARLVTLRLSNFWNGAGNAAASVNGGGVWFDDVRIHPADAQMTTYTHLPLVGVTSISDANNRPVYYEYDGLQRLRLIKDQLGNSIKHFEYHYKR